MDKISVLKQYFGHSAFRPGQEQLIDALLAGRDVLGVMPTGAGKSMCYQVPALLLEGVTLVVSPLISLMKDQVAALTRAGVPAAYINSSLTPAQYHTVLQRAEQGAYRLIYIAPERLPTAGFLHLAQVLPIAMVAVDEAHCVSQWGQDFRPGYLKITEFIDQLPHRPVVGAFTATATGDVKQDIVRLLALREPLQMTTGFDRPNLYLEVVRPARKLTYLCDFVQKRQGKSGVIYCATRKAVESVCGALLQQGIPATRYHAGLEDQERKTNQEDFVYDRARVMVATNAFGMGIDKSNVGFVVHYNMPKNLEGYYQEAGRAGRDGEAAECVLLFSDGDVQTAKFLLQNAEENDSLTQQEREQVQQRDLERLNQMVGYCRTTGCLRSYLLEYFGEHAGQDCGNCGNCKGTFIQQDITTQAQMILSGVARVEKRFSYGLGMALIIRMLRGSAEQRVLQLGLDQLSTYGVMRTVDRGTIRSYIEHLIAQGYLELSQGEYPVLHLRGRAGDVLFRGERVLFQVRQEQASTGEQERKSQAVAAEQQPVPEELMAKLKALRAQLAQKENVPVYIIFSNAALTDMALKQPRSMAEFLGVSGVGQVKAARYGPAFLEVLLTYTQGTQEAEQRGDI